MYRKITIYFVSVAVAVDSSHMTASSSVLWRRFSPLKWLTRGIKYDVATGKTSHFDQYLAVYHRIVITEHRQKVIRVLLNSTISDDSEWPPNCPNPNYPIAQFSFTLPMCAKIIRESSNSAYRMTMASIRWHNKNHYKMGLDQFFSDLFYNSFILFISSHKQTIVSRPEMAL